MITDSMAIFFYGFPKYQPKKGVGETVRRGAGGLHAIFQGQDGHGRRGIREDTAGAKCLHFTLF